MIKNFKISNFRIFGQAGSEYKFKPITFLTGPNSSGKSSLVKAIMVVRNYIETLRNRYSVDGTFNPGEVNLNVSSMGLKLGNYLSCVNKDSGNGVIDFSYEVTSDLAPFVFEVSLSFDKSSKVDGSLEGELISIEVKLDDETILLMIRENRKLKLQSLKIDGNLMYSFTSFVKSMCYNEDAPEEWGKFRYVTYDTYFKNKQIQKRYPALFGTQLTKALKKLDESSLMFYFPILEEFKTLNKDEAIAKLSGLACSDSLEYTNRDYKGNRERVIKSFTESTKESFYEYYLELENKCLDEFTSRYWPTGYHTRFDLIRDEVCQNMELECESTPFHSWPVREFEDAYTMLTMGTWDDEELSSYIRKNLYYDEVMYETGFSSSHLLYEAYREFVHLLLSELLMTSQFSNIHYVNDSFTSVQRLYTYANKSSFAQVIREYADLKYFLEPTEKSNSRFKAINPFKDEYYNKIFEFKSGNFINKWLKELSNIDSLLLSSDEDGLGFIISVKHANGRVNPLADEGHGITQLVHLLLQIECQILRKKRSILDVPNKSTINCNSLEVDSPVLAIEEPEVSLHPSIQSKLALVFNDAYQNYRISFIIETHSEYLIRKSQAIIAQYDTESVNFDENPFKIYYFNQDGSSYEMKYRESGRFENTFGSGFFDEASNSIIEVLKRERKGRKN